MAVTPLSYLDYVANLNPLGDRQGYDLAYHVVTRVERPRLPYRWCYEYVATDDADTVLTVKLGSSQIQVEGDGGGVPLMAPLIPVTAPPNDEVIDDYVVHRVVLSYVSDDDADLAGVSYVWYAEHSDGVAPVAVCGGAGEFEHPASSWHVRQLVHETMGAMEQRRRVSLCAPLFGWSSQVVV